MSLSKISQKLKVDQLFRPNGRSATAPRKPKARFLLVNVEEKLQKYLQAIAGKDASEFTTAPDTDRALKLLQSRPYHLLVVSSAHVDPGKVIGDKLLNYIKENKLAHRITLLSGEEMGSMMPKIGEGRDGRARKGRGKPTGAAVKRITRFRTVPLTTQHIYQVVHEVVRNPFELPKVTLLSLMGFNDRARLAAAGVCAVVLSFLILMGGGEKVPPPLDVARIGETVVVNPQRGGDGPSGPDLRARGELSPLEQMEELDRQLREAVEEKGTDFRPAGPVRVGLDKGE